MTFGAAALVWATGFAVAAVFAFRSPQAAIAGLPLAASAFLGAALAGRAVRQLVTWPPAKLCLFRDRLLVLERRREIRALWTTMGAVTLAEPDAWPSVRVTDRLTIQLRNESAIVFKPAAFGLAPAPCRDLIVRLRDEPNLRSRLPEFDSVRDLTISPVVAGELIEPRL